LYKVRAEASELGLGYLSGSNLREGEGGPPEKGDAEKLMLERVRSDYEGRVSVNAKKSNLRTGRTGEINKGIVPGRSERGN